MPKVKPTVQEAPASQTLSRGIRILEILAEGDMLMIDDIAQRLQVHRSIAYRLLRTLESHGLVKREPSGRFALGARMAALAVGVANDVQAAALPELTEVANELKMTCFLAVPDRDECITLVSVEPRHAVASVVQRPGARHSLLVGAPSKAILSILPDAHWPAEASAQLRTEIAESRIRGYMTSHDEVLPSVQSVAVPLELRGRQAAAIAVVHVLGPEETSAIALRLQRSAAAIRAAVGG